MIGSSSAVQLSVSPGTRRGFIRELTGLSHDCGWPRGLGKGARCNIRSAWAKLCARRAHAEGSSHTTLPTLQAWGLTSMPTSHSNHQRRTLLLTGASRGIGHATVKRFSAAGWRAITCSRHAFPENCPWEMGPEDHIQVDLADLDQTQAAIAEIKQRLDTGELNALVNNAAISPKAEGGKRLSSIDTTIDVWDHIFRVNFFAPIMLARGLLEELKAAKGSVVNVTSIAGSRVHPFAGAAYAKSMLGEHGIAIPSKRWATDVSSETTNRGHLCREKPLSV